MKKIKGFTLIELMVALAIIGIIAAIALPGYKSSVRKANRQAAQAYLLDCSQKAERFYSSALTYNGITLANTCPMPSEISALYNNNIALNTDTNGGSTYNISLTAKNDQVNDTDCTTISLDHAGRKSPTTGCW